MKELTLVFLTCGEFTEQACLKSIQSFRDQVEFIEIRNVFPQIKALNRMIDEVQTQYFIPLDADFILAKDAWSRIDSALQKYRFNSQWHSILFPLWDTLTERKILALKILKTAIMKENLFLDSPTPDVEHYQRLKKQGYNCIDEYLTEGPIGKHVIMGKHFCYNKFRDVYQTYRNYDYEWDSSIFMGGTDLRSRAKCHFDYFLRKFLETGKKDYMHCVAGMMDGILSPLENKSKTLEHQTYPIKSKYAIDAFYNWYSDPLIKLGSGSLIF